MPPGWRYDPVTGTLIPPPQPPPVAWDRPVAEPLPPDAPWAGSILLPAAPLHDQAQAQSAFMYGVPPRAEWPLYVKGGR
jgi:hypothetical protein